MTPPKDPLGARICIVEWGGYVVRPVLRLWFTEGIPRSALTARLGTDGVVRRDEAFPVMAGLVPAIPMLKGAALHRVGITGPRPVMTW